MTPFVLPTFPDSLNQIQTLHVPLASGTRALCVSLRWHEAPALWFLSISDATTGEELILHIPLRASAGAINDLLKPFRPLSLGSISVFPLTESTQGKDPGKDDLADYEIIWSDPLT